MNKESKYLYIRMRRTFLDVMDLQDESKNDQAADIVTKHSNTDEHITNKSDDQARSAD